MKEKAFVRAYRKFKQVIVYIRNKLKKECSEDQLYLFMDTITDEAAKAIESYDTLRSAEDGNVQLMSTYRRQADTIEACTKDLITFINSALMEIGVVEFNVRQRRDDLRTLKKPYTASIYSQVTAVSHRSIASSRSQKSQASAESKRSKIQSVSQRSIASSPSQKSQASTESKNSQASNSSQHSIASEA